MLSPRIPRSTQRKRIPLNLNKSLRFAGLVLTALCCIAPNVSQAQPEGEGLAGRVKRVETLMQSNQLVEARPDMEWLKEHVDAAMYPQLDFYIALSYVFEFYETDNKAPLSTASEKFQAFLTGYPRHEFTKMARYNLGDIEATLGNYEEALKYYIPIYNEPGKSIDRKEILKKILLIYVATQKWEEGIPYFEAGMRLAESKVGRTNAAAYLMIGQAKTGDVSNMRKVLEFFDTPSPVFFSPRFNTALMEVGDKLQEEQDFATASLFYQFAKEYEELQTGLEHYIRILDDRVDRLKDNIAARNKYMEAKTEYENALSDLQALQGSTNYTPILNWKIAKVYMDMSRNWEAFWRFRNMVDRYPNHEFAEDILFNAYSLGNQLGQTDISIELSERYFAEESYTKFRGTIADEMTDIYLAGEQFDEVYEKTKWYLEQESDDTAAKKLLFKHGMARMMRYENKALINDFEAFRSTYEDKKAGLVIRYFLGLAYLLEQQNQQALDMFNRVLVDNSDTRFKPDALFRKALATMGLDRVEEARDLIKDFIRTYPENPLRATAELTLGNIIDLLGDANTALTHYYLVDQYTEDRSLEGEAELKISRILVFQGKSDEAVTRLVSFIQRYREYPETIPVAAALAEIYSDAEQPRVALAVIKDTLDLFFELTEVDDLDPLLVDYIQKDRALRESRTATEVFFDTVSTDAVLLEDLIRDRAKQYRYFKEHKTVETLVKDSFTRDNDFRDAVIKELDAIRPPAPQPDPKNPDAPLPEPEPIDLTGKEIMALSELEAQVAELNTSIPELSADEWLAQAKQQAKSTNNIPLNLRVECALARTEKPAGLPTAAMVALIEQPEIWKDVGAAAQIWIMREKAKLNPSLIITILEDVGLDFINTSNEMDMHLLLAETYMRVDRLEDAIERYGMMIKRFSQEDEAAEAILTVGQLQIEIGQHNQAREGLESILHRPDWRGQKHAEAFGFYERIMLGYPGFQEILATAFYEDLQTLQKMGESASVQTVYEAFKATPGLENTQDGQRIIQEFE